MSIKSEPWSSIAPFAVPPVAAAASIVPPFYGLIVKSAQQLGNPIPKMPMKAVLFEGIKAGPLLGAQVGVQIGTEKALVHLYGNNHSGSLFMLASALLIATLSAPGLIAFNGKTIGRSVKESLQAISFKQTGAIVIRDTSFLFSLRISEPVSKGLKETWGDSPLVERVSAFSSGVIGSVIGHPADTVLTRSQKELPIIPRQLMNGVTARSCSIGIFAILFNEFKKSFIA